jgi:hypothetical protein
LLSHSVYSFPSDFFENIVIPNLIHKNMSFVSLQNLMVDVGKDIHRFSAFYSQHVLPDLAKKVKATYIAAAIAAFISYQVYKYVHIPKKLRHIPAVPFWLYMSSALSGTAPDKRLDLIYPVLAKSPSGVYLKPDRGGGWSVSVVGPQALKILFLRKGIWHHHM